MQVKYRNVKLNRTSKNKLAQALQLDNPYTDKEGIGGKARIKTSNQKPTMPERQDIVTQIRQLEASIKKDQRRLANGLALRRPDAAGNVVRMIAAKRERILQLLDKRNQIMASKAEPAPERPHIPAKVRPERPRKSLKRWSEI